MPSIKELRQKYNQFITPIAYLKIKGKKISNKSLYYKSIETVLTTGFESSLCRVQVEDISSDYVSKKLKFDKELADLFVMGAELELYLGYDKESEAIMVFSGFITLISFELSSSNNILYQIEAMDLKSFMMNNRRSELKKDIKKYSDAVSDTLKDYSGLFKKKKIDDTSEITTLIEQHNQSDYDFVVDIAKKNGYLFFIDRGELMFIKYATANTESLEVFPSASLMSFKREVSLNNQIKSVIVRSHNEKKLNEPIEATAKEVTTVGAGSKSASDLSKLVTDKMSFTIIDNSVTSVNEAKSRAEAELIRQTMSLVGGEVVLVGIPDVFIGTLLKVSGMPEDINGKYLITEVIHYLHENKYTTTCRFGANKV